MTKHFIVTVSAAAFLALMPFQASSQKAAAPPLVITKDQADTILSIFDESLAEVAGGAHLASPTRDDASAAVPR